VPGNPLDDRKMYLIRDYCKNEHLFVFSLQNKEKNSHLFANNDHLCIHIDHLLDKPTTPLQYKIKAVCLLR